MAKSTPGRSHAGKGLKVTYGPGGVPTITVPKPKASSASKKATVHKAAKPKPTSASAGHEPAIYRSHATLESFDAASYTATIQLTRSPDTTVAGVPVSRAISSGLLTAGVTVAVIFFDHHNSADAMIVGVH